MIDVQKIKQDFPIFKRKIHGKEIVYLDNAATSQTPIQVINKIKEVYENYKANVHRGIYTISEEATLAYEETRKSIAQFINAKSHEIIFTKNSTEALNLVAYGMIEHIKEDEEVLISEIEHHSNLVTWQQLCKRKKVSFKMVNYPVKTENIIKEITPKTKIIAITHVSNVLGSMLNIKEIAAKAHQQNALVVVDGSQSAPHRPIDVKELDCDFFTFSAHKMLGPFGVGILYGKREILEKMNPMIFGGNMVKEVTAENTRFNDAPWKFEAGTQNIADVIAFGEAIEYLKKNGMSNIQKHEEELTTYAIEKMREIKNVKIYGYGQGIISFNIFDEENNLIHSHDVSTFLDREGICVRGGNMCAMPLVNKLGEAGVVRMSTYIYNNRQDIDRAIEAIKKIKKIFDPLSVVNER